jgi:hypothetical protein
MVKNRIKFRVLFCLTFLCECARPHKFHRSLLTTTTAPSAPPLLVPLGFFSPRIAPTHRLFLAFPRFPLPLGRHLGYNTRRQRRPRGSASSFGARLRPPPSTLHRQIANQNKVARTVARRMRFFLAGPTVGVALGLESQRLFVYARAAASASAPASGQPRIHTRGGARLGSASRRPPSFFPPARFLPRQSPLSTESAGTSSSGPGEQLRAGPQRYEVAAAAGGGWDP